jgi:Mu transposase, C-terminal domain
MNPAAYPPESLPHNAADTARQLRFCIHRIHPPDESTHHKLTVVGDTQKVRVMRKDALIAEHPRDWGREQVRYDPVHYLALLERRPGAFDVARPLDRWDIPPCFGILRRKLEADWPPPRKRPRGSRWQE